MSSTSCAHRARLPELATPRLFAATWEPAMTTQTYQPPKATGAYEITMFADTKIDAVTGLKLGIVHFPKGKRSPPEGRRISARVEMAYVISGQLQVETDSGAFVLSAGDSLLGN